MSARETARFVGATIGVVSGLDPSVASDLALEEAARMERDIAWARSDQRTGTLPRVRRAGFDAGYRAGYEQAVSDMQDVEAGEMKRADLLYGGAR